MNPEQFLNDVAVLIAATAKNNIGRIYVVRHNDEIKVMSSDARSSPVQIIASYNAEDAREGLTAKEWSILSRRLSATIEEIEQCSEQSKL